MANVFAKLGATTYVLWGILHIEAARKVYMLGQTLDAGIVQGRLYQDAWNILFFALFGMTVGIYLNWNNSRLGYWLNFIVVSAGDIGFIVAVLIPGHIPLFPGVIGPFLWLLALIFSTVAVINAAKGEGAT